MRDNDHQSWIVVCDVTLGVYDDILPYAHAEFLSHQIVITINFDKILKTI